ncbi:MAG: hypothetical protein DRJ42_19620 [Deltaproteobacteria bacterium]|nr:MAG: hypothetical protein DRJ42_19620 [Deltaproteobacteria bacterium]
MLRSASLILLAGALVGTFAAAPEITHACGGCFAPTGQPSVVTAHRMVVSVTDQETTLWDQFEYGGDPENFVWVLPVAGGQEVDVDVAEQSFFQFLADQTQVTLQGPASSRGGSSIGCSASDGAYGPTASATNVTIYAQEVVGPYETVTIGAEDAGSLVGWLTDNDYVVPDALLPTIAHYVAQDMNFVVLRLSPTAGVSQMQPVRVTTPGAHVSFPLRMIAAGIGTTVSLELFLIAEGRWEAQNFPNAEVDEADLVYDWATSTFNYDDVVADVLASNDGRTWLTEFSAAVYPPAPSLYVTYEDGAYHGPRDDWDVATRHITDMVTVTRMRAELPASALANDLVLQASTLGTRPGLVIVDNEVNRNVSTTPGRTDSNESPTSFLFMVAFAVAMVLRPGRRWRAAA